MKSSGNCDRVVLAGRHGCRVIYCEDCNVAEVEVGSLSLRLEMQAFNALGEMMQEAMQKLAVMNRAEKEQRPYSIAGKVH
jgi:hypothetical protein